MSVPSVHLSDADAALLHEVDEALTSDRSAGGASALWVSIAQARPQADPAFRSRLRGQLAAADDEPTEAASGGIGPRLRPLLPHIRRTRLVVAAALLALVAAQVGIAVAQGGLENVVPVIIREPIERLIGRAATSTKLDSDAALQRLVPFSLWVPSDVPCAGPNERTYKSETRSASLLYQCVHVTERASTTTFRPLADEGTLEEVSVNGLLAYYFKQTVVSPTGGARQTNAGLVFEREGTIVMLFALPHRASPGAPEVSLDKADLIRIAESMTKVRER